LGSAAWLFQYLYRRFIAVDDVGLKQMIAHQVDQRLHCRADAHHAGCQRATREIATDPVQQRGDSIQQSSSTSFLGTVGTSGDELRLSRESKGELGSSAACERSGSSSIAPLELIVPPCRESTDVSINIKSSMTIALSQFNCGERRL
jgi:hypothetical protein